MLHKIRYQSTTVYFIKPEKIISVQSMSNYSKLFLVGNNKPIIISKTLQWVQERLPPEMFARVHRSHLVNKQHVQYIKGNATKTLVLSNGEMVLVSRRKMRMANRKVLGMVVV